MRQYKRVDDLVGDIVSLTAQLVEDRMKKMHGGKINQSVKGGLEDGGDDTFFDYCFNGLQTVHNMMHLLRACQSDEFLIDNSTAEMKRVLTKIAVEENMQEDFYFQDCISHDEEAIFTKMYEMVGLKKLD